MSLTTDFYNALEKKKKLEEEEKKTEKIEKKTFENPVKTSYNFFLSLIWQRSKLKEEF